MNIQALMKQAQSMQKKMLDAKDKIDNMIFEGKSELVKVKLNGKREVKEVKFENVEEIEKDDIEMLEDMVMIAMNDALSKIEKEINDKLGSQAGPLGGMF